MTLPTTVALDIPSLTNAQLVALYRAIDETGRASLAGIDFSVVEDALHRRASKPDFTIALGDLEAAYDEVSDFLFTKASQS